jgi:hypothetical protein
MHTKMEVEVLHNVKFKGRGKTYNQGKNFANNI